jgi:hypothetical protein
MRVYFGIVFNDRNASVFKAFDDDNICQNKQSTDDVISNLKLK